MQHHNLTKPLPSYMQQLVFERPGQLAWRETKRPVIDGAEEAIVHPLVMGRCDLDRLYLQGVMPLKKGEPIGHEIIGEIVDLGSQSSKHFAIGQKVIVPAQISCGGCAKCREGLTGRCDRVPFGASYGMGREGNFGGALSEFVRVPYAKNMLVPVPPHINCRKLIGLADMSTDAWRAVGPMLKNRPGATTLVMGGLTPVIAIYAAGLAKSLGSSHVVYVDSDARNRAAAARFGVDVYDNLDAISDQNYDIIVDASGNADWLKQAFLIAAPASRITSVAPPFKSPELPLMDIYMKGCTYHVGRPDCRHGHEPVLQAWASCGFQPETVPTTFFEFGMAHEGWLSPDLYVAATAPSLFDPKA